MSQKNDVMDFLKEETNISKKYIAEYLKQNNIFSLSPENQLIKTVKLVSEIPWGKGRNIEEVLLSKKVGTCTGKHLVLQECFNQLGIKSEQVICTFRWGEQGIKLPDNLQLILNLGEWDHAHNFLRVHKNNGTEIDIDITWNSRLKKFGFITIPENWDGNTSVIAVKMNERWDNIDMKVMKVKLIESLTQEIRERREKFLENFIDWVNSINR